jgi:hypothetical protein
MHILIIMVGAFLTVGGTYSTVQLIIDAYADGSIGEHTQLVQILIISLIFLLKKKALHLHVRIIQTQFEGWEKSNNQIGREDVGELGSIRFIYYR